MKKTTVLILLLFFKLTTAQETVGLVNDNINETKSGGYTLFDILSDDRVYLINNCGEVVNQWDYSGQISDSSYLLENGNLLQSNFTSADIRDWDNNIIWSVDFSTIGFSGFTIHHDIEPLPNGNFLVLIRDTYSNTDMFNLGKDTSFTGYTFTLDKIVEIEPVGTNSANIVWEWKFLDHLIQDFDVSKPNFGVISANPQLIDMNYDAENSVDFTHSNALDYNENLDQIMISSRHLNEIYIIDHSTTTIEASSNSGGIYGKGGDFLWRWGNPDVYDNGTVTDQKIGRQHDSKWITDGTYKDKISVFSNDGYGSDLLASSIHIIEPDHDNGVYNMSSGKFLPNDYFWSWDGTILGEVMQGSSRCGMQIMSNGNALINETNKGRLTEVDNAGNVIWVYEIPVGGGTIFNQFTDAFGNGTYKAQRYPENYIGFDGITLDSLGIIEDVNSISDNCSNVLSVDNAYFNNLRVYPNPTKDFLNFNFDKQIDQIKVYDLSGKIVLSKTNSEFINLENLADGLYLIKISVDENSEFIKIIKD